MSRIIKGEELLCPIKYFMDLVGGKWKVSILCVLSDGKPHRYGNIRKRLGNVTNTMLAKSLQELEFKGIINRVQYNEIPPRVEYSLTDKGDSLIPIVVDMAKWTVENNSSDGVKVQCKTCREIV